MVWIAYMLKKIIIVFSLLLVISTGCNSKPIDAQHGIAISSDGTHISYSSYGKGVIAIIFIHGWSCDSRYWKNQIYEFAKKYRVITIDLAGHGHSSSLRKDYTLVSFSNDIKAVIDKEKIDRAILVGHSMGGSVIAEAAKLMPKKVIGIIGIDTLHNVAEILPRKELNKMIIPFEKNFVEGVKNFVSQMFPKDADPELLYWVSADMSSAPKEVAVSAITNYMEMYARGEVALVFKDINVPVITINGTMWPTDEKANKENIKLYDAIYIEDTGHFPMLENPNQFNKLLKEAILQIQNR